MHFIEYRIAHFVFEGVTGRFFKITNMVYFCHEDLVLSLQNSADPDEMLIVVAGGGGGGGGCSGRVLDSRLRDCRFGFAGGTVLFPLARHNNPCLVLVQPRKNC